MKKALLVVLILGLMFAAFADDAKVMPKGVIRVYVVPSYVSGTEMFNYDGEKVDFAYGDYSFFNLGAAVEFGINDWITGAVQWAPGMNLYSDFSSVPNQKAEGPFELFTGAKFQLVGPAAPVQNDMFRFAAAAGVMIPMAFSYDAMDELIAAGGGNEYNIGVGTGALGIGARVYADYIINKMFFVNLYGEFIYFLEKDAEGDFLGTQSGADTVNYGYKLTGETELQFSTPLAGGLSLSAGLPVTFVYEPQTVYNDNEADSDFAKYTLSLNPNASVFVTSLPLPLEFKISDRFPLMGQGTLASNTLSLQIKAYMKF